MNLLNRAKIAMFGAEFLGSAVLVTLFITLAKTTAVSYFVATSAGITLLVVYMLFARMSGAHANPAITFGMWTARKISTMKAIAFIIAQMLGGLAAWGLYQYLTDHRLPKMTNTWEWRVFVAELVGTAILAMAYSAAANRNDDNVFESSATVGAALFIGVMIAALAVRANAVDLTTGQSIYKGFINPAVALGTKNFSAVYLVAPLVGGLVGANLYNELFGKGKAWIAGGSTATATKTTTTKSRRRK